MRFSIPLMLSLIAGSCANAQTAPFKPTHEIWETVFARDREGRDQQIGFAHLTVEPITVDGKKIVRATRELRISVKRGGQDAELRAETGTDEDDQGKVTGIFMKQWTGKQQTLTMRGSVTESGKSIDIKVDSTVKTNEFTNPWDTKVIGLSGEATLFHDRKVEPGDSFRYRFFEPTVSSVITIRVEAKELEVVLLPRGGKKKLLRLNSKPEKIGDIQLPSSAVWIDPVTLAPVVTQTELPGFGLLTLLRSTEAAATGALGEVPDLLKSQTIRLPRAISGEAEDLFAIVYRITINNKDADPAKIIKEDDRQSIKELKGNTFELHVLSKRSPQKIVPETPADPKFLSSNHFINCDDENVKKLAEKAAGDLADPWEKAKAIERWVRANMKPLDYTEAMATSDHVAKTLSGDCTEYAMLTAAMCRAQKIPSRTAIGLIYHTDGRGASMTNHMWTEVYIKGQWLGLDATLGRGSIGPGHIKITDHSWHDVLDFKPLLPVFGFFSAKPTIEIKGAFLEKKSPER